MSDEKKLELLLAFFKALGDENRLQIVGLLLEKPHTVEELAEIVGLGAPTISHHLKRLAAAGLVEAVADQHYHVYSVRRETLRDLASQIMDGSVLREAVESVDTASFDRKVVGDYIVEGKLKTIPSQRKKREAILRHLVARFEHDRTYPEREVNAILAEYHEDVATLRREFIGYDLMRRENGDYWRV
jgi:predicted transcriptional regulator